MQKKLSSALKQLADTVGSVDNKMDLKDLLEDLLTPKEILEIKERIQILKMLKKGLPQREIALKLGISVTTVNRGSRILKWGTGAADKLL